VVSILLYAAIYFFVLFRFGFLTTVVASSVSTMLVAIPIVPQPSSWVFSGTLVVLVIAVGVALYGLRTALAGRPVFSAHGDSG
jgi:hypothetical protein